MRFTTWSACVMSSGVPVWMSGDAIGTVRPQSGVYPIVDLEHLAGLQYRGRTQVLVRTWVLLFVTVPQSGVIWPGGTCPAAACWPL